MHSSARMQEKLLRHRMDADTFRLMGKKTPVVEVDPTLSETIRQRLQLLSEGTPRAARKKIFDGAYSESQFGRILNGQQIAINVFALARMAANGGVSVGWLLGEEPVRLQLRRFETDLETVSPETQAAVLDVYERILQIAGGHNKPGHTSVTQNSETAPDEPDGRDVHLWKPQDVLDGGVADGRDQRAEPRTQNDAPTHARKGHRRDHRR